MKGRDIHAAGSIHARSAKPLISPDIKQQNGGQKMGVSVQILTEFHPESRCDPKG
jgi:hypothetical protein